MKIDLRNRKLRKSDVNDDDESVNQFEAAKVADLLADLLAAVFVTVKKQNDRYLHTYSSDHVHCLLHV